MKEVHILMVDDHPAILSGYDAILKMNSLNVKVHTTLCYSILEAFQYIGSENLLKYDFIFLDKSMPPCEAKEVYSGIDLAKRIQSRRKSVKIAMLTSHAEPLILSQIKTEINPIAILTKSDIDYFELQKAFSMMLEGKKYYSPTVINSLSTLDVFQFELDATDRLILLHLSEGIRTKSLPNLIPLSLDMINKRKAKIKMIFKLENGKDEDLIRIAKELGIVE
uniref:response regulator n=1 Tax=Flavobacterium sp. TaxID=239 RepID=UPI00404A6DBA